MRRMSSSNGRCMSFATCVPLGRASCRHRWKYWSRNLDLRRWSIAFPLLVRFPLQVLQRYFHAASACKKYGPRVRFIRLGPMTRQVEVEILRVPPRSNGAGRSLTSEKPARQTLPGLARIYSRTKLCCQRSRLHLYSKRLRPPREVSHTLSRARADAFNIKTSI